MTDFRALCARMADELDHYRQLLMDDRREAHALATEARAALAQPEPQGPTDEELLELWTEWNVSWDISQGIWSPVVTPYPAEYARAILARWGRHAIEPVPVSERPWERKGWCDAQGQCWMGDGGGGGFVPSWRLCKPSDSSLAWSLPHHALPVPQQEVAND